jgi:fumarylacetoacetase
MTGLDETHDPARMSWIEAANDPASDFPIQNLPFGVFSAPGRDIRCGIAIGDQILDLRACAELEMLKGEAADALASTKAGNLNGLMALDLRFARALRRAVADLLDVKASQAVRKHRQSLLCPADQCTLHLPTSIGDYTDFYAGIYHAIAAGALMLPDNPLPVNYKWIPIAYHGRASSVQVSGNPVRRPLGQFLRGSDKNPHFGPSERLDIELEMGFFVGKGNRLGSPVPIEQAAEQIFGFCLLNDWSARDIQRWEMFPLGPFLGKNFGTTISPWVVTADALAPFRVPAMERAVDDPKLLPYLFSQADQERGGLNVDLEVRYSTRKMREAGEPSQTIITSNSRFLYWTPAQMVAHHASGGCNLASGDLVGTGTISGPDKSQLSSLLELTSGTTAFEVGGERRIFLENGDRVSFQGRCRSNVYRELGFGECWAEIEPAPQFPVAK